MQNLPTDPLQTLHNQYHPDSTEQYLPEFSCPTWPLGLVVVKANQTHMEVPHCEIPLKTKQKVAILKIQNLSNKLYQVKPIYKWIFVFYCIFKCITANSWKNSCNVYKNKIMYNYSSIQLTPRFHHMNHYSCNQTHTGKLADLHRTET